MNTILNLYIKKENLEFGKSPGKFFRNLQIFGGNLGLESPLENFLEIYRFLVKIQVLKAPWKFLEIYRFLEEIQVFETPIKFFRNLEFRKPPEFKVQIFNGNLDSNNSNCGITSAK